MRREATTASTRLRTLRARKIAARWILTVPSLMPRSRAMTLFGLPWDSSRSTSIWRSVSSLRRRSSSVAVVSARVAALGTGTLPSSNSIGGT